MIEAGHVPHTTGPAAVATELVPFADAAFADASSQLAA